ncbi:MAG: phosphoribosylamine--glycine ligase [Dokdonella sp.]
MRILVIGSGGREHALAWRLGLSPKVEQVFVAPGNPGTAAEPKLRNIAIAANDTNALLAFARDNAIDLTVVGPEGPLVNGIVDRFNEAGLRCFGPTAAAAQLEGSKAYAKDFLARHNIPTAHYAVFDELAPALAHVRECGAPIVIKADGLAAGKGVVVAMDLAEAETALHDMLGNKSFGDASSRVVIEEFLVGEEASYIVICDGKCALPMATSQDHKRIGEGDTGPNTGGMGAYSPAPVVSAEVDRRIMDEVIRPTLAGMAADGNPFTGFLYAGLMIDASSAPKVIEFNVRFGDPETQPIMLRLRSNLADLIDAALDGRLNETTAQWDPRPAIAVVLAAEGYPASSRTGDVIGGADAITSDAVKVFHAGTALRDGQLVSAGGRVLSVCALGSDIADARAQAYEAISTITLAGGYYRRDIAHRALHRA